MSRSVPQGRLSRLAKLAAAGARSGAGMLLSKASGSGADQTAAILGNLRGLAAKVGQMASYVDGVVPAEHRLAYETAMKGLRAAAPTSSPAEIRSALEEALGAPVDRLFAEWSDTPVASASIGQVHRARLADGREVAVKVQHPGIAKAMEGDLKNAGLFEAMAAAGGARRFQSKEVLEVMRTRFREELDYRHEAAQQTWFREFHAGDPHVRVPEVIASHSAASVLTSAFVRGADFDAACEAPAEQREAWAQTLWRFVFKGNLKGGRFNADPHPGNYIFHEGGAITFLDFGCIQPLSDAALPFARGMHRAAIGRDEARFREAARGLFSSRPGRHEDLVMSFARACFDPLFEQPFRFTRDYAASLVHEVKRVSQAALKLRDDEILEMPSDMFFINRLEFGLYSILARLDVTVDYAEVERSFMHELPD